MTGSDDADMKIDIAVCTYRRAEMEKTLLSLADLTIPEGIQVRIIVADNDTVPSARGRVDALRSGLPFEIAYVHCPASNISIARNACLDQATGDFVAFIDDDETASSDWLAELVATIGTTGADAVLGPVSAVYPETAPGWMSRGDFHSTAPVWVHGAIITGYTCNVLLRRSAPSLNGRRFNLALGRTGGEDTEFFTHMVKAGGRIAFAEKAWVVEPVPPSRASMAWLAKRRFRSGQTHGRLLQEGHAGFRRWKQIAIAGAKAGYCLSAAAACFAMPIRRGKFALRGVMHVGVVSGLFGLREIEQYGTLETSSR